MAKTRESALECFFAAGRFRSWGDLVTEIENMDSTPEGNADAIQESSCPTKQDPIARRPHQLNGPRGLPLWGPRSGHDPLSEDQFVAARSETRSVSTMDPPASISRSLQRGSSIQTLPSAITPSPMTKKRKPERQVDDPSANGYQNRFNRKFLRSRFRIESLVDLTQDESDGLDDSEFQAEHEKYLRDMEKRTRLVLEAEKRAQLSLRSRIEDKVVGRLEERMEQSRKKASGRYYQAARFKVIREEARRKQDARERNGNRKRQHLPRVIFEHPLRKIRNVREKVG
jgi:hypothetical protein